MSVAPEQPGPSPEASCFPLEERGALLGPGQAPLHNDIFSVPALHAASQVRKSVADVSGLQKTLANAGVCLKVTTFNGSTSQTSTEPTS